MGQPTPDPSGEHAQPWVPPTPTPPTPVADPSAPPGLPYAVSYWIGVLLGLILVLLGGINAVFIAGHGDTLGLSTQAFAWLSIFGIGVGFLGRFFPNVQHTVAARRAELSRALLGYFPRDVKGIRPHD